MDRTLNYAPKKEGFFSRGWQIKKASHYALHKKKCL